MLYLESRQAHLRVVTISTWLERIDFLFHFVRVCCPDHWSKICIEGTKKGLCQISESLFLPQEPPETKWKKKLQHKKCFVELSQQYKGHTRVIEGHQNVF